MPRKKTTTRSDQAVYLILNDDTIHKKQQQEQKQRSETLDSNRRIATDLEKEYNSEFTRYCNFEIKDNLLWIKSENKLNPLDLSDIESIKMLRSFINKNFKKEK